MTDVHRHQPTIDMLMYMNVSSVQVAWTDSYKLYGRCEGVYTNYIDGIPFSTYADDYFFVQCLVCGECTREYPTGRAAKDRHFVHCARVHGYVYPYGQRLNVHDRQLQDLIRLAQKYELSIPHLDDHSGCIKQFIQLEDGSQIVGCGIHKGNETKVWTGPQK